MEGLEKLISLLDVDRKSPPGSGYELARRKLIKYFEWQGRADAEELADESIDRVCKRINNGQQIDNLMAYFYGVARLVLKERQRKDERERRAFARLPTSTDDLDDDNEAAIARTECHRKCLQSLPEAERELMLAYCQATGRSKIDLRRETAAKLGIKIEALRLRAFRIREKLNKCVVDCLKDGSQ